jgi:lipoprotein-anchoring transpeptidase ErfK/SrfK
MVLDSQMPRSGFRRSYMSSPRRRRQPRWPWIAVAAFAGGAILLYSLFSEDSRPGIAVANDHPSAADAAQQVPSAAPAAQQQTPPAQQPERTIQSVRQMPTPAVIETTRTSSSQQPARTSTAQTAQGAPPAIGAAASPPARREDMLRGMRLIEQGQVVEGRTVLSKLLTGHPPLSPVDEQHIRDVLTSVNQELVFSPKITPGDPLVERYVVQSGDRLARVAPRYKVTYQLVEQINRISAQNLQADRPIKLIKGPFFAVVSKSQFRMDIYLMDQQGVPVYVRSFPVGLGENDSTPTGTWVIKKGSKTVNPDWRNPRTGEYFKADDPKNPIGEYWLALEGLDDNTRDKQGFGIHGTIEPDSIGRMMSLGCIRLNAADIEQVFKLLVDGESKVYIVP